MSDVRPTKTASILRQHALTVDVDATAAVMREAAAELERVHADAFQFCAEGVLKDREIERLRAALLNHTCTCGDGNPDHTAHDIVCGYRLAMEDSKS